MSSKYRATHSAGTSFTRFFRKLVSRLDESGAERAWRGLNGLLRQAHRELRGSRQARVTRRVLLDPLSELLSWRLGELSVVVTSIGEEEESQPLYIDGEEKAVARVLAISAESSLDLPPEGLHRRFAPAHRLVRVLEQEGLTWGILLNAYELRIVRRSEGFVSSHLAFSLLDMADDVPGARSAWKLLWGVLRGDSWQPSPSMLDEVVPSVANINRKLVHFSARKYPPRWSVCCRARSPTQRIGRFSRILLPNRRAAEVSLNTCTPAHSAICTDFCSYSTPKHADCSRWICQPIATAMRSPGLAAWFAVHSTAPPIRE
jgi:hypothetical protein